MDGKFGFQFEAKAWRCGHYRYQASERDPDDEWGYCWVYSHQTPYGFYEDDDDEEMINAWYDAWKESLALKELLKAGSKSPAKWRL